VSSSTLHDRTAHHILEAAAAALASSSGTASMSDVAREAGVSRATLYNYFATREDLTRALFDLALDEALKALNDADLESGDAREALTRASLALLSTGVRFAILFTPPQQGPPPLKERVKEYLEQLFQRGLDSGDIDPAWRPESLAHLFFGLLAGSLLAVTHGADTIAGAAEKMTTLMTRGWSR
jgi:AcrR family transcriptional regulator